MNKGKLIGIGAVILVGIGILFLSGILKKPPTTTTTPEKQVSFDPKNAVYEIDGKTVQLVNGIFETVAAPGSASKVTIRYFGNDARGDLNGDGQEDVAFLITKDAGGSGLFYYVVVALKTPTGYKTTNAFLIGDRIAPQSTNIIGRELHVNYSDRKPGEPMTTQPSVGVVKLLKVTAEGKLVGLIE
jgi:hypothetical protein